jgi:hypothetical protein
VVELRNLLLHGRIELTLKLIIHGFAIIIGLTPLGNPREFQLPLLLQSMLPRNPQRLILIESPAIGLTNTAYMYPTHIKVPTFMYGRAFHCGVVPDRGLGLLRVEFTSTEEL